MITKITTGEHAAFPVAPDQRSAYVEVVSGFLHRQKDDMHEQLMALAWWRTFKEEGLTCFRATFRQPLIGVVVDVRRATKIEAYLKPRHCAEVMGLLHEEITPLVWNASDLLVLLGL